MTDVAPPNPAVVSNESIPAYRAASRGGVVNLDVPDYREPFRNDPGGDYRTAARPNYAGEGRALGRNDWPPSYPDTQAQGVSPFAPPTGSPGVRNPLPSTDYRNDLSPPAFPRSTSYPSTDSPTNDTLARQIAPETYPPSVDPGAAQFDGRIEKPTTRTYNDDTRPSLR